MKTLKKSIFFLPMTCSVGGNVYVPPTVCPRPAYSAVRTAACVERTGRAKMNVFAAIWPATGPGQNSFILEVG
jgi:hypothetical protein